MDYPLVSVILATYNWKEKWFAQTLDAILNQSYKNIELIIINDASTNNVEDVILRYCKKYDNIVYLKNEKNSERSYSRNRWIFESKWKYIAFCDDDDIWNDKDKLMKQVELLEKDKDYVLCWTSIIEVDENNKEINRINVRVWNDNLKSTLLQSNQFAFSSVMIRKEVLFNSGLFNSEKRLWEDYDLWLRIWRYWKIDNINDSFIWYRVWQWNTTSTWLSKMKKETFKFMLNNRKYYPNFIKAVILRIGDCVLLESIKKYLLSLNR